MNPNSGSRSRVLRSWKEIAVYLGRDVRTVIRWEKERGLPIRREPGLGRRVTISAIPSEIDQWLIGHSDDTQVESVESGSAPDSPTQKGPASAVLIGTVFLLVLAAAAFVANRQRFPRAELRHPLQFTTKTYEVVAPTSLVAADFNGDGYLDLAVAESTADSIALMFGDGTGNFSKISRLSEGKLPERLAVGDFNRDGLADLAVTNRATGDVAVLLGDGRGSFRESFHWNTSGRGRWVTIADLNHDGMLDLAVACSTAHKVAVLLGKGDGTFDHIQTYDTDGEPSAVVVADFNLDGVSDLAVSDYQMGGGRTVSIYNGVGDGSFRTRIPFFAGFGPLGMAAADLNRDGWPDIVTADFHDSVSVLLGAPNGFDGFRKLQVGSANGFAAIADLDGDGVLDLVVASEHSDSVHILFGDGQGEFDASETLATGRYPDAITVGDFNKDGNLEFAVANTHDNSISVYINRGSR